MIVTVEPIVVLPAFLHDVHLSVAVAADLDLIVHKLGAGAVEPGEDRLQRNDRAGITCGRGLGRGRKGKRCSRHSDAESRQEGEPAADGMGLPGCRESRHEVLLGMKMRWMRWCALETGPRILGVSD